MTHLAATVHPDWLSLREPADHAARSRELVRLALPRIRAGSVIADLGSGTGSMTRWLAPQLPGPQRWMLHDRDEVLLAHAAHAARPRAMDGSAVRIGTRRRDVTTLTPRDLDGVSLVTASALLDLLTADELSHLATTCADTGCPAMFTLSVTGTVDLTPSHWLDAEIGTAFNAHQRRAVEGRQPLGPDAPRYAADAFRRLGAQVVLEPSPWRLGPHDLALVVEWLTGWVAAACEQRPELADAGRAYLRHRLSEAAEGQLQVSVGHADLLALCPPERGRTARTRQTCIAPRG